jgi:hypothetical protein
MDGLELLFSGLLKIERQIPYRLEKPKTVIKANNP